jgi:hypothetical protein
LCTLLGDAENPAHTRWERGGKHFKGRYEHGPSILTYVQRAALQLCSVLARKPDGSDKDLLNHLFSVPEPGDSKRPMPKPKAGRPTPPTPPEVDQPKNFFVECERMQGGFLIKPHPNALRPPAGIQIRAAYEVVSGNPFKRHHPADFDLLKKTGLQLEFIGLEETQAGPNRLNMRVTDNNFKLIAQGFDQHRDLIIEVRPFHDSSAVEELAGEDE